jgi:hypothetical protein
MARAFPAGGKRGGIAAGVVLGCQGGGPAQVGKETIAHRNIKWPYVHQNPARMGTASMANATHPPTGLAHAPNEAPPSSLPGGLRSALKSG